MKKQWLELSVGVFMILGLLALTMLALKVSGLSFRNSSQDIVVTADFSNIGQLQNGAAVKIAGVKVGHVQNIQMNPANYQATVTLALQKSAKIPKDSSASILTEGLLGSNYIGISPGYSADALSVGDKIQNTHSALVLENLIGQFLFNAKKS